MFNRYWRDYPWLLQVVLLMLFIFTLASFFSYLNLAVLPSLTGVPTEEIYRISPESSTKAIKASLLAQAIIHLGTFGLPALLFAVFAHPRIGEYLGLRRPQNPLHWLLSVTILLGILPAFIWGEGWMAKHLHFGAWAKEMQDLNDQTILAYLKLKGAGMAALLLSTLALLPAVGEELLFRGIFLRLIHRRLNQFPSTELEASPQDADRKMVFPVIISALLFALLHASPYGFIFIFIAGCLLALIYFLTGSLLCSILAHLVYNGVQVAIHLFTEHEASTPAGEAEQIPIWYVLVGLLVFAGSFYALLRTQRPLPLNWSSDFRPDEK